MEITVKTTRRTLLAGSAALAGTLALPAIARAAGAEFVYKFGVDLPPSHPTSIWAQKAADRIAAETNGRMELQIFPNSQLGSSTDMNSQIRSGALEFLSQSGPVLSQVVPAASINSVGFAFSSEDEVWKALDGELGGYIRGQIEKAGLVAMDKIWSLGFRQITSSSTPVKGPGDLKGMKIRVPPGTIFISLFKSLAASPTSINYNELYTALQTHIVDAQENPVGVLVAAKLYEVQKYLSITNHMWAGYWFLANRAAFEALPPDIQATVTRIVNECGVEQRAQLAREDGAYLKELGDKGLLINETKPDDFRTALIEAGYYKEAASRFGEKPWALLEKYTGKLG
jgi:tripartite ATP-independent transporter DctP family solute receptor